MPRFVVLQHTDWPGQADHWDLMLERPDALWTWSMMTWPQAGTPLEVQQLPDHRLAYLEYEGLVSGERGRVTRCVSGSYELVTDQPTLKELTLSSQSTQQPSFSGRLTLTLGAIDLHSRDQRWWLLLESPT